MSLEETIVGVEIALGKRLQQARQAAGLTQQQLCSETGLSYSTLAKIERGAIKAPSIFTIESIADVLGVTLDELVGRQVTGQSVPKKQAKSGVRFVYFDINGCLVRFFHSAFTALSKDTNVPLDKIESAFWHYNDEVCRGELTLEEFNKKLAAQIEIPAVNWEDYYLRAIEPLKEMHEIVNWAAEHYSVGLMSNIMPGMIPMMLEKHLLPDVSYTAIVDSSEVNAIKPEAKIYEIGQEMAGVDPSEILLIDDTRANLMAAERMGWRVMWFDDYKPADSAKRVREVLAFE